MSRDKLVIAMLLAVAFLACMPTISAATNPPPVQFFYVPIPESQWLTAIQVIQEGNIEPVNPVQSYISISAVADNTIIYYDQYENGYEPDIGNPLDVYSSSNVDGTQIWGDGDTSNGVPPGVPSDIINEGTVIVLNNPVTTTDPITVIKYGGRDKIAATKTIAVVRAGWGTGPNTLMSDANEVYDTDNWGTEFRVPVGTNIPDGTDYQMFQYTGMTIMAGQDGATVQIDANADNTFETTVTLTEGQSHLVNNGLSVGARVISNNPVQVDLITGNIATSVGYESRFFRLLPTNLWTTSYYTPVSTPYTQGIYDGVETTVWLYNPSSSDITVQYEARTSSTTISTTPLTVPANSYLKQVLTNVNYGAHFYTTGGQKFYALSTTNSGNSGSTGDYYNSIWDWGFALVPESSLTPQLLVGLGIGRDPTVSTNPTENGNPVWVSPIGNGNTLVTVYVDFDADPTTGGLTDPNGNKYNIAYSLRELERAKVYDTIDRDQTGMLLYTLDGTKLVGAWGEDPLTASAAAPGIDMGTGIPPLPLFDDGKTASLYEDMDNDGYVSPGDVLEYTIVIINTARSPVDDVLLQDSLPADVIYVEDSTYLNKSATGITTAIPDSGATAFPLDEGGVILDSVNALPVGESYTITFRAIIKDFVDLTPGMTEVVNTGNATANDITIPFEARTPIYGRIGDFVWADVNANGIQDTGELGVANVTINLLDGSGNPVLDVFSNPITTVTNTSGFYQFFGLLPGNYSVGFIKPIGYDFTLKDQGQDDALDSDADLLTGRTSAITLAAGENNSMMDAGLFQLIPAIDIEKYTYGEDADNATGPFIPVGSTVTWTYNVTNNGNVNLTNVVVTDNMGVTPVRISGDNGNDILEPGEVWVYNATGTATAGQYANIGNVSADYSGTPVNDSDPSHYFGANSSVDIEKYTNGEDADDPTGPFIPIGSTVTWTYDVTNNGNVNLTNVAV
ncbi:MAG: SdrD B-like domain-containing protein, partial [Methanomethylovorans sp.]|uniref:SdrD B-like domain-containing protein n=1 Tax=Methanomethylovorans sp. TaxID=2758717 RepID=UPI003530852B